MPASEAEKILKDMFLSGHYSDMKIICNGFIFQVHRAIVCVQSKYLQEAVENQEEGTSKPEVKLPDEDPEAIERVLAYLYLKEYKEDGHYLEMDFPDRAPDAEKDGQQIVAVGGQESSKLKDSIGHNHARVYWAAAKLKIVPLQKFVGATLLAWMLSNYNTTAFIDLAQETIARSPSLDCYLPKLIIRTLSKNATELVESGKIDPLMEKFGSLGYGIVKDLVNQKRLLPILANESSTKKARID